MENSNSITPDEIEEFYKKYKNSISTIADLDQALLDESDSYEKWSEFLDKKSQTLREIFAYNISAYDEVINSIVKDAELLTPELAEMYLKQITDFIVEGYRDYGVTAPVLKSLIKFYEKTNNYYSSIDAYYFLGVACGYSHRLNEAFNYYSQVLTMCPDLDNAGDKSRQFYVACAAVFRLVAYSHMQDKTVEGIVICYNDAYRYWRSGAINGIIKMERLRELWSVLRTIVIYGMSDHMGELTPEAIKILQDEYEYQQKAERRNKSGCLTGVIYNKFLFVTGQIPVEDYLDYLITEFKSFSTKFNNDYPFGKSNFMALFRDNVKDEDFEISKIFYVNPSCSYVYLLIPELLRICGDDSIRAQAYKEVHQYCLQLPVLSTDGTIDLFLTGMLSRILKLCPEEGRMIEVIHNLLTHRQIATAIHSRMVGELAKMITEHLIMERPTLFYGISGMENRAQVMANKQGILNYMWRAGCLHDIGKLLCADVINLQTRKIIDEEFESIKTHPANGYFLLKNSISLAQYASVAGTHHKSYDDTRGYPQDLVHSQGPDRIFSDICTICDVIDAAVDLKGRNYAKGKNFDELFEELKADKGTRYSPAVIDAIEANRALQLDINEFLGEGRRRIQYEVYRRFVITDVALAPDEENFMRAMREDDVLDVAKATGKSVAEVSDLFARCSDYSYLVQNGEGKLFGNIMCLGFGDKLIIMQLYVRREIRKKGIATMLLDHLVATARRNGITTMYTLLDEEEANNAFARKIGFHESDRNGYLMKEL